MASHTTIHIAIESRRTSNEERLFQNSSNAAQGKEQRPVAQRLEAPALPNARGQRTCSCRPCSPVLKNSNVGKCSNSPALHPDSDLGRRVNSAVWQHGISADLLEAHAA